jgi:hypothetical protein
MLRHKVDDTPLFPEYLGDADVKTVLDAITNFNKSVSSIPLIRGLGKTFTVQALFDIPGAGTEHPRPDQKRFVSLVLTVDDDEKVQ